MDGWVYEWVHCSAGGCGGYLKIEGSWMDGCMNGSTVQRDGWMDGVNVCGLI